jgi:hypothetical protein
MVAYSFKTGLLITRLLMFVVVFVLVFLLSTSIQAASNKDYLTTQTTKLLFELSNQRYQNVVDISDKILTRLADDASINQAPIHYYKASALARIGRYSAAKLSFQTAKLQGNQPLNWFYEMAIVEFRLKDYALARQYITHYLDSRTDSENNSIQQASARYYASLIEFSDQQYL